MLNTLYVGDFTDANKFGSYIEQSSITKHFCEQNPCECRLCAQYDRLNMEIIYLQIFNSVYKRSLSVIDHLDYHFSMNSTNQTDSKE